MINYEGELFKLFCKHSTITTEDRIRREASYLIADKIFDILRNMEETSDITNRQQVFKHS